MWSHPQGEYSSYHTSSRGETEEKSLMICLVFSCKQFKRGKGDQSGWAFFPWQKWEQDWSQDDEAGGGGGGLEGGKVGAGDISNIRTIK